ncbi:hypothetical protein BT93_L2901 [Corymbia citriodora subsp. variegata]|uniref:Cytochrome P450 n=1 Tax=Corymbia citriodora subsp. variegata TaxID=360336 RepID=A0A8T0CIQ0_CORYI|nr:hypothetical protein BT93_L2901 [Corymbia citriodora subsp. variegata]
MVDHQARVLSSRHTIDALAAGTDTTYTVLEWAMTELLRHPNAMGRAQAEVRRIAGHKSSIAEDDLDQLRYLKAVIKETLRSHPPIPLLVPRESTQDTRVMGYDIAAGTRDMLAGATDTIYTVMDWAMTELLRHPQAMNILQTEVRKIANGKPNITDEDLKNTHYLRAVLKETLRLHPPIPLLVPRLSSQDIKIRGYDIAVGTTVITNVWTIGRDPSTWDEPDEFKPERFLNSSVDFKGQDFELIPFGAGRRGCPGTSLAMATNELVLANLVDKFDWALPEGLKAEDLDMTECTGLTIHRKVHLLAVATTFPS